MATTKKTVAQEGAAEFDNTANIGDTCGNTAEMNCGINEVQEKVDIFVPRGQANEDPNMMISVNGVNYVLPRGKTSTVPREVADEYYRSVAAQQALDDRMSAMQAQPGQ